VEDATKGQVPEAFVTLLASASPAPNEEMLIQRLVEVIGPITRPRRVHVLLSMPRTRSCKIVHRLLREMVVDGITSGDTSGLEGFEVLEKLRQELTAN